MPRNNDDDDDLIDDEEEDEDLDSDEEELLDEDEELEDKKPEKKHPKVLSKPKGRPPINQPTQQKPKKRYLTFVQPERIGVIDTQTNEPLIEGIPRGFEWLAEVFANLKCDLEELKDSVGRI